MKNGDVIFYPIRKYPCGCVIWHDYEDDYSIEYCAKHKAAPELYETLLFIDNWLSDNIKASNRPAKLDKALMDALTKAQGKETP